MNRIDEKIDSYLNEDYKIVELKSKYGEILLRKIGDGSLGISIRDKGYDSDVTAEYFINKQQAIEIIKGIKDYFKI